MRKKRLEMKTDGIRTGVLTLVCVGGTTTGPFDTSLKSIDQSRRSPTKCGRTRLDGNGNYRRNQALETRGQLAGTERS